MNLKTKLHEKASVYIAQKPAKAILLVILAFNVCFFLISAAVISALAPSNTVGFGFWESVFYTISMILDAGCISYVVSDVGTTGVATILVCLLIVLIGMVTFTGAVIGYLTNYISTFVEESKSGRRPIDVSNHTIILNWNSRASEIINDMLYSEEPETIIVLSSADKEQIEEEIHKRITGTIERERERYFEEIVKIPEAQRRHFHEENFVENRLTIIVRQGDVFSSKELLDISIDKAKTVVILSEDFKNSACRYDYEEKVKTRSQGNALTIKTLIQVAELTGAERSADNQKIVVEVCDAWTMYLVEQIIGHKERFGKCTIVPIEVNVTLGRILSQFTIMPELNAVYSELFSDKGAFFASRKVEEDYDGNVQKYLEGYLSEHRFAIPLTIMETRSGKECFYITNNTHTITKHDAIDTTAVPLKLNSSYWMEKKNIIILGHNSEVQAIMDGFDDFRNEWNFKNGGEILNIIIIDDKRNLEKNNYYIDYPYVTGVFEADIFDREAICSQILKFSRECEGDTSILILSDDMAPSNETDTAALTYLIYVQDVIKTRELEEKNFRRESVDIIVEVIDPKNSDVVSSYSVDNVVISNRYISKMINQIGSKEAIFDFYKDILSYDESGVTEYESNELYIKKVHRFFDQIPQKCTAEQLIRSVYEAGPDNNKSLVIGYVRDEKDFVFFTGDQSKLEIELRPDDKLIVFTNH